MILLLAALCPFSVTLDPALSTAPVSGRLVIAAQPGPPSPRPIEVDFLPGDTLLASREVSGWRPGQTVCVGESASSFGTPRPGGYNVMAILDRDRSFGWERVGGGDFVSATVSIDAWGKPAALRLARAVPKRNLVSSAEVKLVEFTSPLLSKFWKRPIVMRAGVVLPASGEPPYPSIYHVHGFGDNHSEAWREAGRLRAAEFQAVHIFLDGSWTKGHHVFADSVNNGPWATALVTEFIPHLEQRLKLTPVRFLTGHSSGGWSTLWLQVNYPDFFGGVWSTSPDPVDFRNFSGIDLSPGSNDNPFRHELVRGTMSFEQFWRMEEATGPDGGQIQSFNWVFSPKGPVSFFDPRTGELNQNVLSHWTKYDIARKLKTDWPVLKPKLDGKLRLFVGDKDHFFLNESAKLLCDWLTEQDFNNACEFRPGRDHFTVLDGLLPRIAEEMRQVWLASQRNRPQAAITPEQSPSPKRPDSRRR